MNKALLELSKDLNDLSDKFPVPVGDICDRLGIKLIFAKDMPDDYSGKIEFINNEFVITINDNQSYYRNVFTIAHELGHYLRHNAIIKAKGFIERKDKGYSPEEIKQEKEANHFASKLLMPEDKFIELFYSTKGNLNAMQEFFKVSSDAIKFRAANLGLITL